MKVFYHNDLDGQAAGFCVLEWAAISQPHDFNTMMHPINYNQKFPLDIVQTNEQVWIVDYSIEPSEMKKLMEITNNITWIDHHKTAIEKYKDLNIHGIRSTAEAACVLTFKYLHCWSQRGLQPFNFNVTDIAVPRAIALVGDRDTWTWAYGEETKYFYAGSQLYDTSPGSTFWHNCLGDKKFFDTLIEDGHTVEIFKEVEDKVVNKDWGFECKFENFNCWAVNRPNVDSNRLPTGYDIVMPFKYDGNQFTVSLYSSKTDVSVLAKKYGGGGHPGASGFQCKELPFEKSDQD